MSNYNSAPDRPKLNPSFPAKETAAAAYERALRLMRAAENKEAFLAAEAAFRDANGFSDADALADQCREKANIYRQDAIYATAARHMERKSLSGYLSAAQLFASIPGWRDADAQAAACRRGIDQIHQRKARVQEAARAWAQFGKRAAVILAVLIPVCVALLLIWHRQITPRLRYKEAVALMEQGDYLQAWDLLEHLTLKDSAERRSHIRARLLDSPAVGATVLFGSYEQDGNVENGSEAIRWRVLEKEGNRVLLLSEYGLDIRPYQSPGRNITWETCQLRAWLNGEFLQGAFSADEQKRILSALVAAEKNPLNDFDPGNDTEDRLFLLSLAEAYRFFPTDAERQCPATAYAKRHGAYANKENANTWWWLRTPGGVTNYAAYVLDSGAILETGYYVSYAYMAIRPAMWLELPYNS